MDCAPAARHPLSSHWQAGGWFGSQLGGTAWLLVGSAFAATRGLEVREEFALLDARVSPRAMYLLLTILLPGLLVLFEPKGRAARNAAG